MFRKGSGGKCPWRGIGRVLERRACRREEEDCSEPLSHARTPDKPAYDVEGTHACTALGDKFMGRLSYADPQPCCTSRRRVCSCVVGGSRDAPSLPSERSTFQVLDDYKYITLPTTNASVRRCAERARNVPCAVCNDDSSSGRKQVSKVLSSKKTGVSGNTRSRRSNHRLRSCGGLACQMSKLLQHEYDISRGYCSQTETTRLHKLLRKCLHKRRTWSRGTDVKEWAPAAKHQHILQQPRHR